MTFELVNRRAPLNIFGILAVYDIQIDVAQFLSDGTDFTLANQTMVDLRNRSHISGRAGIESFVAGIKLAALDRSFYHLKFHFVFGDFDHRIAGDAY